AIGLAAMFGILFPLNFDSPYKSTSIVLFWRRWHMTLSRFLRDYLYIPLGGNRHGAVRRRLNLLITMVLGGLWHGASWNFAIWGAIHGGALMANHGWRRVGGRVPAWLGQALTLLVVVLAWVPFRAPDLGASVAFWRAMAGLGGGGGGRMPEAPALLWLLLAGGIALFAPNSQEIMGLQAGGRRWSWRMGPGWAIGLGLLFGLAVSGTLTRPSAFLYFRF
ncbi:MAG: MBOAT family O-acyltransferase, partial [Acetobacteraceae bacterium]|nr:MBOAT family O-acyltransferase [Acetobacteraceae bacterium]